MNKYKVIIPIFAFVTSLFTAGADAQTENLNARDPLLKEGSLFTVQFTPGSRKITVSLAGKKGMELSPGRFVVLGKEISTDGEVRRLEVKPSGGGYTIQDDLTPGKTLEVEVIDSKDKGKKESFKWSTP